MSEWIKERIRRALFYFAVGDFQAESGTLKFRFLEWLYGNGEPEFDVIMPEDREGR